ncbi:ATP synthase F0 subunit C [Campylobacter canadensis]|uniref:ATP synthase subunit c n=1 Tax=Campylobacter canadensis TaxID=449520 RepID=A0ABS7WV45_9BACT|nr:ATP synthase F0 subunit C [Campylobacter canadensis]MBZ7987789.1 ATP synthase F0 subunit C [Campylobacter canadensis]MBZ7995304.1 ATP synthase F0 subunit C [Campylobacter canadensis]MBZ7997004.1 ATP synthase F0 subunit C [Campylobacter canadensis]MBZ7999098.1 ATP synthase F0 subunit C [Campylobacter canadensis]MBZ8000678.1 ATP synthase F0 subunit C [Campylobacter canadensis]
MKKLVTLVILSSALFAAEAQAANELVKAFTVLAVGLGLGIAALGGAVGMGNTAAATIAATARNPSIGSSLMKTMFLSLALIEAQVIYSLVIGLVLLYGNPLL